MPLFGHSHFQTIESTKKQHQENVMVNYVGYQPSPQQNLLVMNSLCLSKIIFFSSTEETVADRNLCQPFAKGDKQWRICQGPA